MPYCLQEFDTAKNAVDALIQVLTPMKDVATKPAMVFDIDETLIFNHPSDEEQFTKNQPVIDLYNWGVKHNIDMFIVTARPKEEANAAWTKKILDKCNITSYKRIYYKPREYESRCSSQAKWHYRERINNTHGHTILVSVGDKWGDLLDMEDKVNIAFTDQMDNTTFHIITGDDWSTFGLKLKDLE